MQDPAADAEAPDTEGMHIPDVLEEMRYFEWCVPQRTPTSAHARARNMHATRTPPSAKARATTAPTAGPRAHRPRAALRAGLGISREEAYRVFASLSKLQGEKRLETIRFFGKVLGTAADYYVAEARYIEAPEAAEDADAAAAAVPSEENGTGCNACVYFVTNDPSGAWSELPAVTPAQVAASRNIRKFFTGNLAADVRAFPPFPGKEREYLRAQIVRRRTQPRCPLAPAPRGVSVSSRGAPWRQARLTHATVLCPASMFSLDEDNNVTPTELPEDAPPGASRMNTSELAAAGGWRHRYAGILGIGRCSHPPKAEEEEEGEEGENKGPELEAEVSALGGLSAGEWAVQQCAAGAGSVVVARSTGWPGASNVANAKEEKFASFYHGYGHEALGAAFAPLPPPQLQALPDDLEEQADVPLHEENQAVLKEAQEKLEAEGGDEPEEE